jgi:hypothetical protein
MRYKFNASRGHKIPKASYRVTNWPEYDVRGAAAKPGHSMKGHMLLTVDDEIEQEHYRRDHDPAGEMDQIKQAPVLSLSEEGHADRSERESQAHNGRVQHPRPRLFGQPSRRPTACGRRGASTPTAPSAAATPKKQLSRIIGSANVATFGLCGSHPGVDQLG